MSLRVLVCGGRDFTDRDHVFETLDQAHADYGVGLLIHGGQTGADTLAGEWAEAREIACLRIPAEWKRLGRSAGPTRNARMLRLAPPDKVIAFPGGIGTKNMVKQAYDANFDIVEIPRRKAAS